MIAFAIHRMVLQAIPAKPAHTHLAKPQSKPRIKKPWSNTAAGRGAHTGLAAHASDARKRNRKMGLAEPLKYGTLHDAEAALE